MKKLFLISLLAFGINACSSDDGVDPVVTPPAENMPEAVDDALNASENTQLIIEAETLLANDELVDKARITSIDSETSNGGTLTDNRDGTYTYMPPEDFQGEDNFSYTICVPLSDRCDTAEVVVSVGDAGDPVARDDEYETQEGTTLSIKNYLENDDVVDNATLSTINTDETSGTVVLENDGSITYTPENGFSGEDTFSYTICDDDETPSCSTALITVLVIDAGSPVANDDSVILQMGSSETSLGNLLNNDEVIDDAEITSIDDSSTRGTVTLKDDGTITYQPPADFEGEDSFTYSLCDNDQPDPTCSEATVSIQVISAMSFDIPAEIADYYQGLAISGDEDMNFQVLSELTIGQHTTILSYGERHQYLYDADEDLNNPDNVILIYSGESRYWEEYWSDSNTYSPQTFNTEHIYPQSRLESEEAVTDLHHLRVADADVNELRLNFPFVDGSGSYELINNNSWYPGDEWKGDVARMVLYLNLRYNEDISKVGNLDLFLKWNREDPVSEFEQQRNNVIETAQGNRNPFIDNPYLITLIWGGEAAENTWD
ncbi:Ig-like domain-containing protein [Salegentibacter sp.]|uniref:Ig-like domain-containing protein n=1 Tax=Salegentibacter sp. TaxID=1903072 RepID=UPI0035670C7F